MTDIAIALSAEKDIDVLLDRILHEAMDITAADGGTVYIINGDELVFRNMITISKGTCYGGPGRSAPPIPPIKLGRSHVCACAALDNRKINIADVYDSDEFDFTGAKHFDETNNYRTGSMLVLPMVDENDQVIGVLQLINAQDSSGKTIAFAREDEDIISALASLAAVSLNNRRLLDSVQAILHSFVEVMVEAIDARSPYNANHTRHMVQYADLFLKWCRENGHEDFLEPGQEDAFRMSIWLHDIGKLVIPMEIMDKPTRLGDREETVKNRLTIGALMERIRALESPNDVEAASLHEKQLLDAWETIRRANTASFLADEEMERLAGLKEMTCLSADGDTVPVLIDEEYDRITVRKGTLTSAERKIMESHVSYTARMLQKMCFDGVYQKVPAWAASHHELLDGSGYPDGKGREELPREVRLLTILDIFDALTAEDRPYKPAMPREKALSILAEMAEEGKLDPEILALFQKAAETFPINPIEQR